MNEQIAKLIAISYYRNTISHYFMCILLSSFSVHVLYYIV